MKKIYFFSIVLLIKISFGMDLPYYRVFAAQQSSRESQPLLRKKLLYKDHHALCDNSQLDIYHEIKLGNVENVERFCKFMRYIDNDNVEQQVTPEILNSLIKSAQNQLKIIEKSSSILRRSWNILCSITLLASSGIDLYYLYENDKNNDTMQNLNTTFSASLKLFLGGWTLYSGLMDNGKQCMKRNNLAIQHLLNTKKKELKKVSSKKAASADSNV
jgi:hypothetical protein